VNCFYFPLFVFFDSYLAGMMPYGFFILFFTLILFKEDVSLSIYYVYSMLIFFVTYCFYMYFFDLFICRINQKKIILPLWLSTAQGVALSVACYGIVAQMRCMQHVCWASWMHQAQTCMS